MWSYSKYVSSLPILAIADVIVQHLEVTYNGKSLRFRAISLEEARRNALPWEADDPIGVEDDVGDGAQL
jgi:hypothetical protein